MILSEHQLLAHCPDFHAKQVQSLLKMVVQTGLCFVPGILSLGNNDMKTKFIKCRLLLMLSESRVCCSTLVMLLIPSVATVIMFRWITVPFPFKSQMCH